MAAPPFQPRGGDVPAPSGGTGGSKPAAYTMAWHGGTSAPRAMPSLPTISTQQPGRIGQPMSMLWYPAHAVAACGEAEPLERRQQQHVPVWGAMPQFYRPDAAAAPPAPRVNSSLQGPSPGDIFGVESAPVMFHPAPSAPRGLLWSSLRHGASPSRAVIRACDALQEQRRQHLRAESALQSGSTQAPEFRETINGRTDSTSQRESASSPAVRVQARADSSAARNSDTPRQLALEEVGMKKRRASRAAPTLRQAKKASSRKASTPGKPSSSSATNCLGRTALQCMDISYHSVAEIGADTAVDDVVKSSQHEVAAHLIADRETGSSGTALPAVARGGASLPESIGEHPQAPVASFRDGLPCPLAEGITGTKLTVAAFEEHRRRETIMHEIAGESFGENVPLGEWQRRLSSGEQFPGPSASEATGQDSRGATAPKRGKARSGSIGSGSKRPKAPAAKEDATMAETAGRNLARAGGNDDGAECPADGATDDEVCADITEFKVHEHKGGLYINCDLRYMDLQWLRDAHGRFDVVLIDPPWRIRGGEDNDGTHTMLSNATYKLDYETMSNEEILDIDVGALSDCGFLFLWVVNSQVPLALQCLKRWGYKYMDKITWVKVNNGKVFCSHGYHFLHSSETCIVGMKNTSDNRLEYIPKVSNDLIFSPNLKPQSRKPPELYDIIEAMVPGGACVELFARNHNLRPGWLSLGNELGPSHDALLTNLPCFNCKKKIDRDQPRFKLRRTGETLCEACFGKRNLPRSDAFVLGQSGESRAFHHYTACDICQISPIGGVRFSCLSCDGFDVCEKCYETARKDHDSSHQFEAVEHPLAGETGVAVHRRIRCAGCNTSPLIGYRYHCAVCRVDMCQKCFFARKTPGRHKETHEMRLYSTPVPVSHKSVRCDGCGLRPIVGRRFQCDACISVNFCEICYRESSEPKHVPNHSKNHAFSVVYDV